MGSDFTGPAEDEQPKPSEKPVAPCALLQGMLTLSCKHPKLAHQAPLSSYSTSVPSSTASFAFSLLGCGAKFSWGFLVWPLHIKMLRAVLALQMKAAASATGTGVFEEPQ